MQDRTIRHAQMARGISIAYAVTGAGPPLVLIHGAEADHTMFDQFVPFMAADFAGSARSARFRRDINPTPSPMTSPIKRTMPRPWSSRSGTGRCTSSAPRSAASSRRLWRCAIPSWSIIWCCPPPFVSAGALPISRLKPPQAEQLACRSSSEPHGDRPVFLHRGPSGAASGAGGSLRDQQTHAGTTGSSQRLDPERAVCCRWPASPRPPWCWCTRRTSLSHRRTA